MPHGSTMVPFFSEGRGMQDRAKMIGGAAFVQTLFWTWFFCLRYTTALEFDFRECAAMVGVSFAVAIGMALRSRFGGGRTPIAWGWWRVGHRLRRRGLPQRRA